MRLLGCIFVMASALSAMAQNCTEYVLIQPFDHQTTYSINYLEAKDFRARMADSDLPVRSSTQYFNNRILILLEVTGSSDDPKVSDVIDKLADLASQAPAGKPVAFGIFAEHIVLTKGFDNIASRRKDEIAEVMKQSHSLGNRRALYDALHEALMLFGEHQPGDTLLVVTDGADNQSKHNAEDLEKEFVAAGIRLLIALRPRPHVATSMRDIAGEEFRKVKILATETGGGYTNFQNPTFFDFASAGYLLQVELPAATEKPREWSIQLKGDAAKLYKDALIFHPRLLPPCHPPIVAK